MAGRKRLNAPADKGIMIETVLKDVSDIVRLLEDAQKVMDELVRLTSTLLKVGSCSLVLREPDSDELRIHAAFGLKPEVVQNYRQRVGEGISGWVARTGEPLLIENVETHPLFQRKSLQRYSTKSLLSVPLIHQKNVIGVLNVNNRNDGGIFTKSDELVLSTLANFIVIALEKSWMREKLVVAQRQEADLRVAREIQENLLPVKLPAGERWTFAARNIPARWMAGDFFDAIPLPGGRTFVVIGDVSGKGVPAAMHMARVMAYCRVVSRVRTGAAEILSFINELLAADWTDGTFATALACVFENQSGKLAFCSAGHPMPLRLRGAAGELSVIEAGFGFPLGVQAGAQFENHAVEAQPGDTFILYTDGITDARNANGDSFGEKRLREVLQGNPGCPSDAAQCKPDAVADRVMAAVQAFSAGQPTTDDLTLVVIQHT